LDVDLETLKNSRGHAFAFPEQSKQNVFGANVRVIERLGFLSGERQDFFHPRCVRNVADNFCFRTGANLLLDFHSDGLEIEPHFLRTLTATPWPSLISPSRRCAVPAEVLLRLSA